MTTTNKMTPGREERHPEGWDMPGDSGGSHRPNRRGPARGHHSGIL